MLDLWSKNVLQQSKLRGSLNMGPTFLSNPNTATEYIYDALRMGPLPKQSKLTQEMLESGILMLDEFISCHTTCQNK